jgi:ketosteroid isomerase-like protein
VERSPRLRNPFLLMTIAALIFLAQTACGQSQAPKASKGAEDEVRAATMLFYDAYNSALQGNLDPLTAMWSHSPDVSNLSAAGGRADGWNEVHADFQNLVRLYPSGHIAPQDILVVADGNMGYSVCLESGQLRSADGPMINFSQRATNVFRLEDGKWKMVHHHADSGATGSQGPAR